MGGAEEVHPKLTAVWLAEPSRAGTFMRYRCTWSLSHFVSGSALISGSVPDVIYSQVFRVTQEKYILHAWFMGVYVDDGE